MGHFETEIMEEARLIAQKDLRSCYKENGIVAGNHHFTDYWARDGYFAAFGSLALGDKEIVQKMVDMFLDFQKDSGLIPYRIMRGPVTLGKYFGHPKFYKTPKPTYRLRDFGPEVLDGTTLTLLFLALLGQSGWEKAKNHLTQVEKALNYLTLKEKHGLLWDGFMCEWNDVAYKLGNLLYSNVIYWKMYVELTNYYRSIKNVRWKEFEKKQSDIAVALRKRLWNGKFFSDWHDYKRQDYMYPFGNLFAIAWGLTTNSESNSIINEVKKYRMLFTIETNAPKYPWWRIGMLAHLTGMSGYQNMSLLWLQPATAYLEALKAVGNSDEFDIFASRIAQKVVEDGIIHECYERDGRPMQGALYTAEKPFAWSSGLLVKALNT